MIALLFFVGAALYASVGHGGASSYLAVMGLFSFAPEVMKPTALAQTGVEPDRVTMVHTDATSGDLVRQAGGDGFDALVCCEVLEDVDRPEVLSSALAVAVGPQRPAFLSTVANMEAEDHVYLFHDVDEIRDMLAATGWNVVRDRPSVLPGAESWDPLPVNYSALVTSR